jgi:hypothetical protein
MYVKRGTQHFPHAEGVACPHATLSKRIPKNSVKLDPSLLFLRLQDIKTKKFTPQFLLDHPGVLDQS